MSDISNFVQRGTDTMLGGPMSHLFWNNFCNDAAFLKVRGHPFWHLCVLKGAEMTSLQEEPFAPLPAGFRRLLWPPLSKHCQLRCLC